MFRTSWIGSCLLVPLVTGACRGTEGAAVEWSYEGETGPAHWGDLKPEYAAAKTGRNQSPIDIVPASATKQDLEPIEISYQPTTVEVLNNGHTVEDDYHGGGHVRVGGHEYTLAQFHFHSPSEHTIDGKHFPMEMHLVHKDADGNLAVVGVLIAEGEENPALAGIERYFPKNPGRATRVDGVLVNAADLLPGNLASYRYSGSLTTPPCSEGVAWLVLREPIQASKAQVAQFRAIIEGNNRPTQPLHGRTVTASM